MAHPHAELIERFYTAFNALDGAAMAACYAPDIHFSDPVFQDLHGPEAGAMWVMLTGRAKDLKIELVAHEGHDERGSAHWLADYTFASTGRKVHNDVHAEFTFRDGLIHTHHDRFSFYGWARQALGPPGLLLGWTPIIQGKVRRQAREGLDAAMATPAA
jgi:ketosteroid isomerase-like protein